jgi:hypothetical protein
MQKKTPSKISCLGTFKGRVPLLDGAMCVVKMAGGRKGDRWRKRKRVWERLHILE